MVEGRPEFIHLLLTDAFGVAGQDLGLNLIDGTSDGGEEQLPSHTDMLSMWRQSRHVSAEKLGHHQDY